MRISGTIGGLIVIFWLFPIVSWSQDRCLSGDCQDGWGVLQLDTGHKYVGEFRQGRRHGHAVMTGPDGKRITGRWQAGAIREGVIAFPNGDTYTGQWRYRERNGFGVLSRQDGRKYIGEFEGGLRHGRGILLFPDGRRYIGSFVKGKRTGQGILIRSDGRQVIGEFKNGKLVKRLMP